MRSDGKGVAKGETQRGEKSAHHAIRHGVLFSLMGFPLREIRTLFLGAFRSPPNPFGYKL